VLQSTVATAAQLAGDRAATPRILQLKERNWLVGAHQAIQLGSGSCALQGTSGIWSSAFSSDPLAPAALRLRASWPPSRSMDPAGVCSPAISPHRNGPAALEPPGVGLL